MLRQLFKRKGWLSSMSAKSTCLCLMMRLELLLSPLPGVLEPPMTSTELLLATQCAAVTTQVGETNEPPQLGLLLPRLYKPSWWGHAQLAACEPFTMAMPGSDDCDACDSLFTVLKAPTTANVPKMYEMDNPTMMNARGDRVRVSSNKE